MSAPTSGLARITIRAPRRRLDLSVPHQVPLAELLPDVVLRAGEAAVERPHPGWMLRRGDGATLVDEAPLAHQGVRDGDVLFLVPRQLAWPEPRYDDVIEEIADGARARGPLWHGGATRVTALGGAVAVLAAGLAALAISPGTYGVAGAGLAALLLLAVGGLLSRAAGDGLTGAVCAGCAIAYAAVAGALASATAGGGGPAADRLLLAASAVLATSVVGSLVVGAVRQLFVAAGVAGLLAAAAAALSYAVGPAGAAALIGLGVVAAIGLAPVVAVRLGRLPFPLVTADPFALAGEARPARPQIRAAVHRADDVLSGTLVGLGLVGLGAVAVLADTTGVAGRLMAAATAGALLLRARLFPTIVARLPLLAAGAGGLLYAVVRAAGGHSVTLRLLVAALAAGTVIALLTLATAARRERGPGSPYAGRLVDIADTVAVLALAPVACAVLGLYGWVRHLVG